MQFSPPCTPWTSLQNANQRTELQRERLARQRRWSRKVMRNCIEIAVHAMQLGIGVEVGFEQPGGASSRREVPELAAMWQQFHEAIVHSCAWGQRNPDAGGS